MLETLANCTGVLEKAVQCSHGVQSRIYVSLAGWNVEVIAPSVHYAEMCKRALSGVLKTKPDIIDFTIIAADSEFTKLVMPTPLKFGGIEERDREKLRREHGLQYATIETPHIVQVFDERRRLGVQLTCDNGMLPLWEPGSVLKSFAYWIALQNKMFMQHAGTLFENSKGLLFVGRGGSGKSGTVLAGLSAGMKSCGDDHVAIEFGETIKARSIYSLMKQDQAGLERCGFMPAQFSRIKRNWQNKIETRPEAIGLPAIVAEGPVSAIVFPQVEKCIESSFKEIVFKDILDGLVPSNRAEGPGNLSQSIAYTLRLFRSLPIYRLSLGSDAKHVAKTVRRLMELC